MINRYKEYKKIFNYMDPIYENESPDVAIVFGRIGFSTNPFFPKGMENVPILINLESLPIVASIPGEWIINIQGSFVSAKYQKSLGIIFHRMVTGVYDGREIVDHYYSHYGLNNILCNFRKTNAKTNNENQYRHGFKSNYLVGAFNEQNPYETIDLIRRHHSTSDVVNSDQTSFVDVNINRNFRPITFDLYYPLALAIYNQRKAQRLRELEEQQEWPTLKLKRTDVEQLEFF